MQTRLIGILPDVAPETERAVMMVDDLLSKRILDHLSRAEVETLLGPPASVRDGVYVYWAGTDGVIDDLWLEIEFQDGRVSQARCIPD